MQVGIPVYYKANVYVFLNFQCPTFLIKEGFSDSVKKFECKMCKINYEIRYESENQKCFLQRLF